MAEPEPKYNWVARLTAFFIQNRQLSIMLFVLIVLLGLLSLFGLRREGFPQVPVKLIVIQTTYKGAGPAEVEQAVTTPIESELKGNKYISELSSQSQDNVSVIMATVEPSADIEAATQEINSKVASVQLPKDAEKPNVSQPATGSSAFVYGLSGDLSQDELLKQGQIFAREMGQVEGVKEVKTQVDVTQKVRIVFDPARLAAAGVDPSTITETIASGNINLPAGEVASDGKDSSVIFAGAYDSVTQLADVRLPAGTGSVRLGDVSSFQTVIDTDDKLTRYGYEKDGKLVSANGLVYDVWLRDDADILKTDSKVQQAVDRMKDDGILSDKVQVARIYDEAKATQAQIHEIQAGAFGEHWDKLGVLGAAGFAFGGIWLLAIVMAVFVNIRAAVVAVLAVPLSFLITVIVLYFGGITLNTLTLFSMILVLGLVVDPVIVVLEALQRYKDRGFSGLEAAMKAVDSVGLGVLMAMLISTIVFTPFGIVSGVFGEIIRFIPITVIPALVASFFIPVIFLTAIGVKLLKSHHKEGADTSEEASLWRVSLWFRRVNRGILRRWWLQTIIIVVAAALPILIAGYFFGTGKIKSVQFSKPDDTTELAVSVAYPTNRSQAEVEQIAQETEAALNKQEEVTSYFYLQQTPGSFLIFANLTDPADREVKSTELVNNINRDLPEEKDGVYASAQTLSAGPPTDEFPVKLQVYENDPAKLKKFVVDAANYVKGLDGVKRVSDGYNDGASEQITVTPNQVAIAAAGLSPAAVGGQVASLVGEQEVTKLQTETGEVTVEAQFGTTGRPATADQIRSAVIQSPTGPVRVGDVATVTAEPGTGPVQHFNGNRYGTVKAQLTNNEDTTKSAEVQQKLNDWANEHREEYGLRTDAFTNKGENEDIAKSFSELFLALGAAILLTYAVLVVFFRSFLQPLIITFAVPLSFIGVFPALYFFGGGQFGFLEILGMITLVGIVENVGIFVIDYANRRVKEGMDHRDAIALATAVRFRPIFLTKICILGAMIPLAVISPFWRGLASVIVAGVLTAGIASLFTTPVLYHWFYNLSHARSILRGRFSKKGSPRVKEVDRSRKVSL